MEASSSMKSLQPEQCQVNDSGLCVHQEETPRPLEPLQCIQQKRGPTHQPGSLQCL